MITGYKWELYNVEEDPTEFNDLAAKMPEKLKQMQDIFYAEAKKYDVLPLDNTTLARWNAPKPNLTAGRTVFTYSGVLTGVPNSGAPSILNKSYTITAEVEIPEGGAEGMIVTEGGRFGGYGLFLSKSYNCWLEDRLFRNRRLGDCLFAGCPPRPGSAGAENGRAWKRWIGYGLLTLGLLWVVAVSATGIAGLRPGQAGVPLQPARPQAHDLGRA